MQSASRYGMALCMILHTLRAALLTATATLVATPLLAQEAGDPGTPPDTIVVLGRGLALPPGVPAYGSITLDRDRLNSEASGQLESALSDIAGFQQFRRSDSRSANPSSQGVTLRALGGNATSRALVLLDGIPQADPFFGSVPFNALIPDRLGAARVTRGGGAGGFGSGAVAGTIELFSADRSQLPLLSASGFYGSRNAEEVGASFSPDVGAGYISVSGKFARGDGYYTTPEDQRGTADVAARYRTWSLGLSGVAPVGADGEIQGRISIYRDNRTLRFRGADSSSEGQDASVRYLARGAWKVEALAYVQLRDFSNVTISSSLFTPVLNQRGTPSTGAGGKLELRPPVGEDHVLRIGVDDRFATADMYEDAISPVTGVITARRSGTGQQNTTGLYVEDDWTLGNVVLTGGVRGDRWTIGKASLVSRNTAGVITSNTLFPDRDNWEASVRGGALWHAASGVSLRAAGYTSFRLPTLNELYRSFSLTANGNTVSTQANAALSPERLKGGEVGLDVTPLSGLRFSATAFYNRLDNAVANVTLSTVGTTTTRQRQNVDAIVAKGIELSGSLTVGQFDLDASYAFNDSKVEASGAAARLDGMQPAQSPRNVASGTLAWNGPNKLKIASTLRYIGPQYEDDLQTDKMPGVATVDGFVRLPIVHGFSVTGRIENALDATILTRKVGNSVDLGQPRTFWIGVSFGV